MDEILKKDNTIGKLLFEKELNKPTEQSLIKISEDTYYMQIDGRAVRLVFQNPVHGVPLEKALAKIAGAQTRSQNG